MTIFSLSLYLNLYDQYLNFKNNFNRTATLKIELIMILRFNQNIYIVKLKKTLK